MLKEFAPKKGSKQNPEKVWNRMSDIGKVLPNGLTIDQWCNECGLWKLCKNPRMFGEGSKHPKFLFVGEAPGGTEDETGFPFQGDAGGVLRQVIEDVGISLEDCRFTNAVRCFVSAMVKTYTPTGYRKMSELRVGDKVLTHKGRFRRITHKIHNPKGDSEIVYNVTFKLPNGRLIHVLVTEYHEFKLRDGDWIEASDLSIGDRVLALAESCAECQKAFLRTPKNSIPFCSTLCHNRWAAKKGSESGATSKALLRSYKNGKRDSAYITKAAHRKNRSLAQKGELSLQNLSYSSIKNRTMSQAKAKQRLGLGPYVWIGLGEKKLSKILSKKGISHIPQFALGTFNFDFKVGKILVEVLGPGSLNNQEGTPEYLERKKRFAKKHGYKVLYVRYDEVSGIVNLLKNDRHRFRFKSVKVVSIKKKISTRGSWSLSVEEDESFVAKGLVNHNCRPPDNKLSAYPKAVELCRPHLLREIHSLAPKVVILLGNSAIQSVLNRKGILQLHDQVFERGSIKYVCCFHPAYLLRNDSAGVRQRFKQAIQTAKHLVTGGRKKGEKKREHHIIRDHKMLQEFTDELVSRKEPIITDMESSNISPFNKSRKAEIGCVGFALDENSGVCYPGRGRVGMEDSIKVKYEEMMEALKEIYERSKLVGHFEKLGYVWMIAIENIWGGGKNSETGFYADTGLMSYCLNERKGGHDLKNWAYKLRMGNYELPLEQWKRANPAKDGLGVNYVYIPGSIIYPYNIDDCISCFRLFHYLKKKLKEQNLWDMPLKFPLMWHFWTAAMMELEGLNLDLERNAELSEIFKRRLEKFDSKLYSYPEIKQLRKQKEQKILQELYERVNAYKKPVFSVRKKVFELYQNHIEKLERKGEPLLKITPDVKRELVFDVLGYQSLAKTDSGLDSAEKWILEELYEKKPNPLLKVLIKRSELESSCSKYIDPIPRWAGTDGRTHTLYKPQGQKTGRVSSEDPNHENLPKRYTLAKELRSQFVSRGSDYVLLEMDKKHNELRLIADRAKDKQLIKEFRAGKDPHRMGAAAAYEVPEEEVTDEQRFDAKSAVSFGLIYGRTAHALAVSFGWPDKRAEDFKERYFTKYHGVRDYLEKQSEYILEHGEASLSHFGRHRRLPEVNDENEGRRQAAVREGINSPIQGDGSDCTWIDGHRMAKWLFKHHMKSRVVVIIHDAIVVDMYKPEARVVIAKLAWLMRDRDFIEEKTGWRCSVPFDVDGSAGVNLGSMVELVAGKHTGEFATPN